MGRVRAPSRYGQVMDVRGRGGTRTRRRRWLLIPTGATALLAAACGTTAGPTVPRTGPSTAGIRLELSPGAARPGQVVTARLLGDGLGGRTSSGLVEVTCGIKDTRVSHPVHGVTGDAPPPAGRAPVDQPFTLPADVAVRFVVPPVVDDGCVVSRPVRDGTTVVFARTPLGIR